MQELFHFKGKKTIIKEEILRKYIIWFMKNKNNKEEFNKNLTYFKYFLYDNIELNNHSNLKENLDENLLTFDDLKWEKIFEDVYKNLDTNFSEKFFYYLKNDIDWHSSLYDGEFVPEYEFIFVLNFKSSDSDTNALLMNICNAFEEINILEKNNLKDISIKLGNNFENILKKIKKENLQTISINIKSKYEKFALDKAFYLNEMFLGYLYFIMYNFEKHNLRITVKNTMDFSLNQFFSIPIFCILKDGENEIRNKPILQIEEITLEFLKKNVKILQINKNRQNDLIRYNKCIHNMEKSIKEKFFEYCTVYYAGSSENHVQISFIHFWALMEQIIKMDEERLKDKYVRKRLIYFYETFMDSDELVDLRGAINLLYNKRNLQVHEAKFGVNEYDRNFIKRIVDKMLVMFLENSNDADSLNYFATEVYKWSPDYVTIPLEQEYRCFPENDYD